jgi:hypothetical protein
VAPRSTFPWVPASADGDCAEVVISAPFILVFPAHTSALQEKLAVLRANFPLKLFGVP